MTPEKEAELIEEIAAEIAYAAFVPPIDYGGPKVYWRTIVPKRKEVYRREARAAFAIAKPVLRDEALEEVIDLAKQFLGFADTTSRADEELVSRIRALKSKGHNP